jgi:hypothetical protein
MNDREKFIKWYKTVPYFKPSDLCSLDGIFAESRVRVMCDAYLAGRNAALDEAAAIAARFAMMIECGAGEGEPGGRLRQVARIILELKGE